MPTLEELKRQLVKLQAEYDATPKSQRKRLAEISNEIDKLESQIEAFEENLPQKSTQNSIQRSQSKTKSNSPIAKIAATIKEHSNKRKSVKAPSKDKPARHKPQNNSGRTISKKFGGRLNSRQQRASQEKNKQIVELSEHELMQRDLIAEKPELIKIFQSLSIETLADIINSNQLFNTVELMAFFQVYCANILQHYKGGVIKVVYKQTDANGVVDFVTRMYVIDNGLIKYAYDFLNKYSQNIIQEDEVGSDQQIGYSICQALYVEILTKEQLQKMKADGQTTIVTYDRKKGAYLNYLNKIPQLDLSRYQIGSTLEQHMEISQKQCFIHCLQISGQYTDEELNNIEIQVCQDVSYLAVLNLKKIVGLGYIIINDYKVNSGSNTIHINKPKESPLPPPKVRIALFEGHYFINDQVLISGWWIDNYNTYSDNQKFLSNPNCDQIRNGYFKSRDAGISTYIGQIIQKMHSNKLLEHIDDLNIYNYKQISKQEISAPQQPAQYAKIFEHKPKSQHKFDKVIFADYETHTKELVNGELKSIPHKPFMLCYTEDYGESVTTARSINQLADELDRYYGKLDLDLKSKPQVLILFHNLPYDSRFILSSKYKVQDLIQQGTKQIQFKIYLKNCVLTFRDSLRLFDASTSVAKMPKMFFTKAEQEMLVKEIFPYDYYTEELYLDNVGDIKEATKYIKASESQFRISLQKANAMLDEEHFDMFKYCEFYCKQDVIILAKAVSKFRENLKNEYKEQGLDIDLFNYLTISSLAIDIQKQLGCFEDCYEVSGVLRQYLQQFIIGGRTMVAGNQRVKMHNQKIQDFDAVSLYPSAMSRCYYPTGVPKCLNQNMISYYNDINNLKQITLDQNSKDQNTLYLQVKLKRTSKFIKRNFPLVSEIDENGVRQFNNNFDETKYYYYDVISLQDLVEFQQVNYEIISGIYFEGRNYKIQEVVIQMFNKRKHYKSIKNPIQVIYKLILNSAYGKTIECIHDTKVELVDSQGFAKLVLKQASNIVSTEQVGNKYIVTIRQEVCDSYAFTYIGSLILSTSKRIMNEVMCTADDNNLPIFYQDTDSMQIEIDSINILKQKFQEKYNRELIGENMGQFHTDYESDLGKVLYADQAVYVAKKVYCARLVVQSKENPNELLIDYHIRMKGASIGAIDKECNEKYEGDYIKLYENLFNHHNTTTFDLCANKPVFQFKGLEVKTMDNFYREIKFPLNKFEKQFEKRYVKQILEDFLRNSQK
ncbi:DNA_polymerase [Hexamita inflata]|uniref:DNA-directed DNA polymerase n=1 Tax=Hexamita inflata TaxID=28002 RepID=A0AA86UCW3_9EUKA|nr:DNA polymerase [Hexamita inflata]